MEKSPRPSNEQLAREASAFEVADYLTAHDIEVEHFRDLYRAAPEEISRDLGLTVEQHGGSLLFAATGVEHLLFARAHLGASGRFDPSELDSMLTSLKAKRVETFLVHLDARVPLERAQSALEARGLVAYRRPWVKLLRGSEPVPSVACDLEVAEIGESHAEVCAEMLMQVFGLPAHAVPLYRATIGRPGWRWYMASENGVPAATGVLFQRGTSAYLGGGVTLPAFRRRRAQGALIQRRISDALAAGALYVASETGFPFPEEENPSFRNMLYFGLRAVGTRPNFVPPGVRW